MKKLILISFLFLTFFSCQKENPAESILEDSALSISPDGNYEIDGNLNSRLTSLNTEDCCSPITAEQLDVNCVEGNLEICFPILDCEGVLFNSINFNMFPIIGGVIQSQGTPITNSDDNPISLESNCFTITEADGFDPNLEYAIYPYHHADCDGDGEVELIPSDYVTTDPHIFEGCESCCDNISFEVSNPCDNLLKICYFGIDDCGGLSGLGFISPIGTFEFISSEENCFIFRVVCGTKYRISYNISSTGCDIEEHYTFNCGDPCSPDNPIGDGTGIVQQNNPNLFYYSDKEQIISIDQ